MKKVYHTLSIALAASAVALSASAEESPEPAAPTTSPAPDETVVISAGGHRPLLRQEVFEALYGPTDWHYEVSQAPRFLFVDKDGKIAFGIGGQVRGTLQYDFDGSIPENGDFITQEIPVPANPAERSGFNGTVNNSAIYARLVGHSTKLGLYGLYIEAKFNGGQGGNSFVLKQAWAQLGYLRAGKATSIFNDDDAQPYTIDEQGPAGATCSNNVGVQWTPRFGKNKAFTFGLGVEVPDVSYTTDGAGARYITQRAPDIPAYLQYAWADRSSRVRFSAIWRNLSYRDEIHPDNKWATGWGVQITGVIQDIPNTLIDFQCLYGKGVGQYINDFSGFGYDLIPSATPGKLTAPGMLGYYIGLQYNFTPKFFMSGNYSQARLYNQEAMGGDAYRYGQYVAVNAIYEPVTGLQVGVEYDWGKRTDRNHAADHANRIMLLGAYTF